MFSDLYSAYFARGGPRPCLSLVSQACVCVCFEDFMPSSPGSPYNFFDSPVRDNYLFRPCDLRMSMSGRFLARWRTPWVDSCANVPAGVLCTRQGLTCARAVICGRCMDAATFIQHCGDRELSFLVCCKSLSRSELCILLYTRTRTAFIVLP